MTMHARSTALDASLSFQTRLASAPEAPARPGVGDFARSLTPQLREAPVSDLVTVKLVVEPAAVDACRAWVREQSGALAGSQPDRSPVVLATIPTSALAGADSRPWIRRVEAARLQLPRLDEARGTATGLDAALEIHSDLTGSGVVLGIVDTGLDWRHPDFRQADGRTRLERFIHAHLVDDSDESAFDVFGAAALNAALQGAGEVPQGDPHGHGTHCASIAAGNGLASEGTFRGVAPEAALVAMRSEPLLDTHTIEGIRQAFEQAGDRPAVVSLSLGGHLGPHDGTTALENEIARMSGPGRIVVVAAGNEGGDQIHQHGRLVEGEDLLISFRVGDPQLQYVDVWVPRGDEVDLWVETPDGGLHQPDGEVHETVFGLFQADFVEDRLNLDQNLTVFVAEGRVNHRWAIRIRPSRVVHGEVHAWAGTIDPSTSAFLFPDSQDPGYSVGMPGTEERAIVVGSFVSRNRVPTVSGELVTDALVVGGLSPFASHGPTRFGYQKPDLAAPGQYVTAALAGDSLMATEPRYLARHSPFGPYISIQGTSMATPFVAGLVALLLQREPALTPEEVRQRLRITASRDAHTGQVWDPGYGHGKLDARALLDHQATLLPS